MKLHLFDQSSNKADFDGPTALVVNRCSTQITRKALAVADPIPQIRGVIGWVEITSPNLVDLIDDLVRGPGGTKLTDLRVRFTAEESQSMPIQRGLAIIGEAGLGIRFEAEMTDASTAAYLGSLEAQPLGSLPVS